LENWNRGVFKFNDAVDRAVVKPAAEGYVKVVPQPARTGVTNFFSNLSDVPTAFNSLLQLKVGDAITDVTRFAVNSTLGFLGFIDVASALKLPKHREDFGQTLGYWGVGSGPYLVLPLLGPSTARDGPAIFVDSLVDPLWQTNDIVARNWLAAERFFDARVNLLGATGFAEHAAIDRYTFIRDIYLERRKNLILDGKDTRRPDPNAPPKSRLQELDDDEDGTTPALKAPGPQSSAKEAVSPAIPDVGTSTTDATAPASAESADGPATR
jgi:phospholipid-binding lipoprotein MlaA